jgi:hypothetical protein
LNALRKPGIQALNNAHRALMNEDNKMEKHKISSLQIIRGGVCIFICLNHFTFFNKYSLGEIGVEYFIILSGFLTAMNAANGTKLRKTYLIDKKAAINVGVEEYTVKNSTTEGRRPSDYVKFGKWHKGVNYN